MIKVSYKIKDSLKLIILIFIFSAGGVFTSKNTYDLLETRIRGVFYVNSDKFYGNAPLNALFNFSTKLNIAVNKFKNNLSVENNRLCPIKPVGNVKPIRIIFNNNINTYRIIFIDTNKENIRKCFDSILIEIKENYYEHIRNLKKQLERDALITQQVLDLDYDVAFDKAINKNNKRIKRGKFESLVISDEKKINFSQLIPLIEEQKIEELAIGRDFAVVTTFDGEKLYTVTKGILLSNYILEKMSRNGTNFYLLNEDDNRNTSMRRYIASGEIELEVNRARYNDLLKRVPYVVLNEEFRDYKVSYRNYMLVILALANCIALIIFFFISKDIRRLVYNWYRQLS